MFKKALKLLKVINMIEYALTALLLIVIFIDTVYKSEYTSLALLISVVLLLAVDLWLWSSALVIVVIIYKIAAYILRRNIIKSIGLTHTLTHTLKPLLYLLVALLPYLYGEKIVFPLMDRWTSVTLYSITIFLSLVLTVYPSLETMSFIAKHLYIRIPSLTKFLITIAHAIGIVLLCYSYTNLKNLIFIPSTLWIIYMIFRKRLSKYYATILAVVPYLLTLILIESIY